MTTDYQGKTAVITGGGSGLGAAMADVFVAAGANVALLDIDGARAEEKAAELNAAGHQAMAAQVDVADSAAIDAAVAAVEERFGAAHILCANVGVQQFGAVDALSEADWDWVLDVNVKGVIQTATRFLPLIRKGEGDRHIVLTSSASYFQLGARMSAYVTSKYAVTGFGEILRQELAQEGINVSLFFPAGMMTRHLESSAAARPSDIGEWKLDPADMEVMRQSADMDLAAHVATADHAVRNLLADLATKERYIFSHGGYRDRIAERADEQIAAFDRMLERP